MDRTRKIEELTLQRYYGSEMESVFDALAALRIKVFHEFPYLYAGDSEYEKKYLNRYSRSSRGFLAALFKDDQLIGAATALPLVDEEEFVKKPFANYPQDKIFYFGESILLPQYRGKGYGHLFFDEREYAAQNLGDFRYTTFCAVQRPESHPGRPAHYKTLDNFWTKRGYKPDPNLITEFSWQDIGETEETKKTMQFWLKEWKK